MKPDVPGTSFLGCSLDVRNTSWVGNTYPALSEPRSVLYRTLRLHPNGKVERSTVYDSGRRLHTIAAPRDFTNPVPTGFVWSIIRGGVCLQSEDTAGIEAALAKRRERPRHHKRLESWRRTKRGILG